MTEDTPADMIRMIVSNQSADQRHSIAIGQLDDAWYVPRWIDNHALSFFVIADQIDEVGHLRPQSSPGWQNRGQLEVVECKDPPSPPLETKSGAVKIPLLERKPQRRVKSAYDKWKTFVTALFFLPCCFVWSVAFDNIMLIQRVKG